jgi:hypothetical protein
LVRLFCPVIHTFSEFIFAISSILKEVKFGKSFTN